MLIQDVERRTGLDRATIRFYEKEEIMIPQREENGYRSYSEENVQLLLKVKLLRQLGVSLFKIKSLQQGSGDFSLILTEQIQILERRIREDTQAKFVCREMLYDGVQFSSLDSKRYLEMLISPVRQTDQSFREQINRESHPWRRYFARMLDYRIFAAILQFMVVVLIRIRPFNSNAILFLNFAAYFLTVPVLAALIHYLGTTPGKWAMGIRLENVNGGRLSGGEALYREGKIVWHGMGLFIPILTIWREYRSYRHEAEGVVQVWNEDTEIVYEEWTVKRKCIAAFIFIVSFSLSLVAGCDAIMPTYKEEGITIKEFAENYRDYEKLLFHESEYIMADNGKWLENENYIVDVALETKRPEFVYNLDESGKIASIIYENSFLSVYPRYILPEYCRVAICAAVGSRPGSTYKDIVALDELLENLWYSQLPQHGGESKGNFNIADVTVTWESYIENCKFITDGSLFAEDDSCLSYDLKFELQFG